MKKPELYKILHNGEVLYEDLTRDEFFDAMDDLAEQYYKEGVPKPDDLVVEYDSDSNQE